MDEHKHRNTNQEIKSKKFSCVFFIASLLLSVISFHFIFNEFFPNKNQQLGGDYSYFLPVLLNGYYWIQVNNFFEIPWFSPAFCGGVPFFPNPQVMFYSLPQVLTLFLDPLKSIYVTYIIFAAIGFTGFYLLLRCVFTTSQEVAILGAILFLFNGFYAHRMIIGHLTYHSFMFIPLIAFFLLHYPKRNNNDLENKISVILSGSLIAYMVHSGAANFVVMALFSVVGIWLISCIYGNKHPGFIPRFSLMCIIAVCLSATKLASSLAFLVNYPRDFYPLPGIEGFGSSLLFVIRTLFLQGIWDADTSDIVNSKILFEQHEIEFGVTVIPLIIIIVYLLLFSIRLVNTHTRSILELSKPRILAIVSLIFLLLLPVILNTYTPDWNVFLKSLPYIKNNSTLLRWIAVEIPLVILVSVLLINLIKDQFVRNTLVALCITGVIYINAVTDRSFYHNQQYIPDAIINSYFDVKKNKTLPKINYIGAFINKDNQYEMGVIGRNDLMTNGISQLLCYEPIFGYALEKFNFENIHIGEIMNEKDGLLNMRNPACYVFGESNNCRPGENFKIEQKDTVDTFSSYKPFQFQIPLTQK
ncbi:MAG: hypothetical protein GTO02_08775, partial [Candidatus Dadabacteria bacterium]|nr:hypothetical protein [Candidatus Dadabacteria bacterium]